MDIIGILGWCIFGAIIGFFIGRTRGRERDGFALGFLWPIGWLVIFLLPDKRAKCPECGGVVVPGANRCKNCGSEIARTIQIACPACGEAGWIPEGRLGEQVECPACKRAFVSSNAVAAKRR